jgi:hypothetical protein
MMFISIGLFFTFDTGSGQESKNNSYIYQTWKVERFYKNGKLVINDRKFQNLRFRINPDSTAEWIRPGNNLKMKMWINNNGSQLIKDMGATIDDIETIYELKKDKLRFGKRNVMAHYEYVMVPEGK